MVFNGASTTLLAGDVLVWAPDPSIPERGHVLAFRYGRGAPDAAVYWDEHTARSWVTVHEANFSLACLTLARAVDLDLERVDDAHREAFRLVPRLRVVKSVSP